MNRPSATIPPSSQNAPEKVNSLETILQVLSNVPSEIVLQEAATAKEATIDALITRFEDISSLLTQAKRQRKLKRKDYANDFKKQQSLDGDSNTLGNRARMPTKVLRQLAQSGFLSTADLAKMLLLTCKGYGADLGRDYIYKHLCRSRWRYITKLPPSLIADRGYHWLFRHLSRGLYKSPKEELPTVPLLDDMPSNHSPSARPKRAKAGKATNHQSWADVARSKPSNGSIGRLSPIIKQ
jgi:hypothetical protein